MSITKASLKNLVARLVISPPPTTLGESTAVLKRLQTWGHVVSFTKTGAGQQTNPNGQNDEVEMTVVFSASSDGEELLKKSTTAAPDSSFTVRVNHDLPDPWEEDPYNVRNLQSRKQPQAKTMTCRLQLPFQSLEQRQQQDANAGPNVSILSSGFSPNVRTRLYQSLTGLKQPPPSGIVDGLAVFHNDAADIEATPDLVDPVPNLMDMYRSRASKPVVDPAAKNHS